uniref:Uncharacterized protein n=1 Tax=Peromyscus maniculatus bairdii TaxID=230844 RepID=A0A8C8W149_PERMB
MNAIHTKEPLLTSHLQSPLGHRQDRLNKPSSETPIVQNLPLATGYPHPKALQKKRLGSEEAWDWGTEKAGKHPLSLAVATGQ